MRKGKVWAGRAEGPERERLYTLQPAWVLTPGWGLSLWVATAAPVAAPNGVLAD